MSETEVHFPPVPRQHYGNPKLTADWVIAHAMKGYSAGLCSQRDARSMAWSQYVKAMGLRPQMDAKDFYKILDRQWETAYSGTSKIEPRQEPKAKAEGSTQWVKVTSVSRVSRVKPSDKNDRSVYFWVNGDFTTRYVATGRIAESIEDNYKLRLTVKPNQTHVIIERLCQGAQRSIDEASGKTPPGSAAFYEPTRYKPTTKPAPTSSVPPILTAPPELAADVLGTGPMGLPPTQATPGRKTAARTTRKPKAKKPDAPKARKPKKAAAVKPTKKPKKPAAPKARKPKAKPKAKKTTAAPKLTASQREYMAIQGFVMVKRGGKYVRITG